MYRKDIFVSAAHFVCIFAIALGLRYFVPWLSACYFLTFIRLMVWAIIAHQTFRFTRRNYLNDVVCSENKAVVISGCDSGFGHLLAKRLDSKGFDVFACCLFPKGPGAIELKEKCSKRLQILGLDVTKDDSVKEAAEFVKSNLKTSELWALVNNAGIAKGFSAEISHLKDFRDCLDVNAVGCVRMTKAFLPILRRSKGRVINMTSIASRFNIPYVAPYSMSKYAALSFSECLRREMAVWGVRVISVEPDLYQTRLTDPELVNKDIDATFASLSKDVRDAYGEEFKESFKKKKNVLLFLNSPDLDKVVSALDSAVTLKYPDIVYKPRASFFTRFGIYLLLAVSDYLQDVFFRITIFIFRLKKPNAAK